MKLVAKYGNNIDFTHTYVSTWVKGKKPKLPDDLRFLFLDEKGEREFMYLDDSPFNPNTRAVKRVPDWKAFKDVSKTHIKNGVCNYYYLDTNTAKVNDMLARWLKSDPIVSSGGYEHQLKSVVGLNGLTFEFDGKIY